jgi:hypothetical protein
MNTGILLSSGVAVKLNVNNANILACNGFYSDGRPKINTSYIYVGVESGKYPYVLNPWFNDEINTPNRLDLTNISGLWVCAYSSGNGVYVHN